MHKVLANPPKEKKELQVPISQYIISLVGCWETYFRGTFIFLLNNDQAFYQSTVQSINITQQNTAATEVSDGISHAELIAQYFNFQNLHDTETAFAPLSENGLFDTIGAYPVPFLVRSKGVVENLVLNRAFDIYKILDEVFRKRHRIVHDANYRPNITKDLIASGEALIFLFPQIFALLVATAYDLPHATFNLSDNTIQKAKLEANDDNLIPYIFSIEDVLGEWTVVD